MIIGSKLHLFPGATGAITLPSIVESVNILTLADEIFKDNTNITSVTIPSTYTSISASAFRNCSNLETITFSDSANAQLTTINNDAFRGLSNNFTSIDLPHTVTTIGNNVFYDSTNLKTINLGSMNYISVFGSATPTSGDDTTTNTGRKSIICILFYIYRYKF